jgi:hypothetical protein
MFVDQSREDRRRVELSIKESRDQLSKVIDSWATSISIEQFFQGVEQSTRNLSLEDRDRVIERLRLAREFLGTVDPLDHFLAWKIPEERYEPRYPESTIVNIRNSEDNG